MSESRSREMTRREALTLVGIGAAAVTLPWSTSAQTPAFPKGAIIRTLLKDYAPEDLAGGAPLFHEHRSRARDFNARFRAAAAAVRAANGAPSGPTGGGQGRATAATTGGAGARAGGPPAPPQGADPMRNVDLMAEELATAKREGVACVVDAGHPDMGRDLNFVRQAAMKAAMPVVAGAGFYSQPFYPKEISTM